ncbi:centromere protein W isoform X2 [Genypterus blacodes]|uniref:centromere protein W isoform X2 n=1 Tax=Genypterus blacodes TaxID=154954 RepID=UPI003F764CD8
MLNKAPKLKSTIKTKTKSNVNVRPASEAMAEMVMLLFLNQLAEESRAKACEDKSATIRAQHVCAVAKVLKKARG